MGALTGVIRAGRAYVEMFADPSALNRALEAAKKRVENFGKVMGKIGLTTAAAGGSVFAPIAKMFTSAVEEGADVAKLASKFGTTAEQISTLRGAFAQAGVGAGDFASAIESLGSKISHAADGNGFLLDSLQSLGTGKELMGKGLDEQLDIIAERIKAIPDEFDKLRAASELGLGAMSQALKEGKKGLDEYRAAAVKNGDVMSTEQAKQALEVQKEYNRVLLAVKSTLLEVGMVLLPTGASFTSVGKIIRDGLQSVRAWIGENKGMILAAAAVAAGLIGVGFAAIGVASAVSIAGTIFGGLIVVFGLVKAAVLLLLSPIGLVVAASVALGVWWLSTTTAGKEAFANFGEVVSETFGGLMEAIQAGDMGTAWEIIVAGLEAAWAAAVLAMTNLWEEFKKTDIGQFGKGIVDALDTIMGRLTITKDALTVWYAEAFNDSKYHGPLDSYADSRRARGPEAGIHEVDADRSPFSTPAEPEAAPAPAPPPSKPVSAEQKKLDEALEKIRKLRANAMHARAPWLNMDDEAAPQKKAASSFSALSESAKGTFGSSAIAQTLGYGDNVGQRQLDAQLGIRDNTAAAIKLLSDMYAKIGGKFS